MKGVTNSSPYGVVYDHDLRDYHDLHKDVQVSRNKLENFKQKRLILQAEVRFLRRRYKYLLVRKYSKLAQGGREPAQTHNEMNQKKNSKKVSVANKKGVIRGNLPPAFRANQKGKAHVGP